MRHLHFDCFSGVAGDMTLGALLDVGASEEALREGLSSLAMGTPFELKIWREARHNIYGNRVAVLVEGEDADALAHKHHGENHEHRHYREIREIITKSELSEDVKALALSIFQKIAEAEARLHDSTVEEVAFHEVGAVDSIVDVVGAAILIRNLNPARITATPLPMGHGFVRCQHGFLPIPAPATLEILRGVPLVDARLPFEFVTPTGAAIIAATAEEYGEFFSMTPSRIGYGIGKRDLKERPNALRVILGES